MLVRLLEVSVEAARSCEGGMRTAALDYCFWCWVVCEFILDVTNS